MDYARAASVDQQTPSFTFKTPDIHENTNLTSNGIPSQHAVNNQETSRSYVPTRKNAIVLDNTQENTQDQCLRAVADVVGGRNIQYCTRLSGGRICMYLSNDTVVNQLCEQGGVSIGSVFIQCRRYVTEATKFIISNCPPEMSDNDLKTLLSPYGNIVSSPTRLRVSTNHEDLKHIKTWRRSVYIMIPSQAPEMPKRFFVNGTDGSKHTIYVERDEVVCTWCFVPGHVESKCKRKLNHEQVFPQISQPAGHRLFVQRNARQTNSPTITTPINDKTGNSSTPIIGQPSSSTSQEVPQTEKPVDNFMPTFGQPSSSIRQEVPQEKPINSPMPLFGQLSSPFSQEVPLQAETAPNVLETLYGKIIIPNALSEQSAASTTAPTEVKDGTTTVSLLSTLDDPLSSRLPTSDDDDDAFQTSFDSSKEISMMMNSNSKRLHSPDKEEEDFSESSSTNSTAGQESKKARKKRRLKEEKALSAVINSMKFTDNFLPPDDFRSFIEDVRGKVNAKTLAYKFTKNLGALIVQLRQAENICMDINLKRRIARASEALVSYD